MSRQYLIVLFVLLFLLSACQKTDAQSCSVSDEFSCENFSFVVNENESSSLLRMDIVNEFDNVVSVDSAYITALNTSCSDEGTCNLTAMADPVACSVNDSFVFSGDAFEIRCESSVVSVKSWQKVNVSIEYRELENDAAPSMVASDWVQRHTQEASGWTVGCKGYGTSHVEAICVDRSALDYRIASVNQTRHVIDNQESYFAESYCDADEVAIGGKGGCHEPNSESGVRPSMVLSEGIERSGATYEMSGWRIGCKGPGAASVTAICVDRSDLQYRASPLGQKQHYVDDPENYYAEAYCSDEEVAIGGNVGCSKENSSTNQIRPSLISSTGIQRPGTAYPDTGYELSGWRVGCNGYGAASVTAICVDRSDLQYRIASFDEQRHEVDDQDSYVATSMCAEDEMAIGGKHSCGIIRAQFSATRHADVQILAFVR